ncbi:MAG: DUF3369 domain-containing protein [Magnetococcales bacterium]|nr:DUF3369 domain-containing protein [Magnetococcales bacterium]
MEPVKKTLQLKSKLTRRPEEAVAGPPPWRVLVVDDEEDVVAITRLNLRTFTFGGRSLELVSANSGAEARRILQEQSGFALGLVDVVMETDDAGLQLVRYIREELGNRMIRLVIRTGQPGLAPERYVIDHFDIDDYKEKSELSAQKLYTTVRSALKSFRDLTTIDMARKGLETILAAAPQIYLHPLDSFEDFYSGVFTQILGLCHLGMGSRVTIANGYLALFSREEIVIKAKVGEVAQAKQVRVERERISATETILPLEDGGRPIGMLYLEHPQPLDPLAVDLLRIFTGQVCVALQGLQARMELRRAHQAAIRMLADAAEAKDAETGRHIQRMVVLTRLLALAMGLSVEAAEEVAEASQLHDVGKIGTPDAILNKPGILSGDERNIIQEHARLGGVIIKDENFQLAQQIALYHHEKWDGSGYPDGLRGEEIPLAARLVAVVDVFDALVHRRPYKKAWPMEEALGEIRRQSGLAFDPRVVERFLELVAGGVLERELAGIGD